jgi:four helix bundle protein
MSDSADRSHPVLAGALKERSLQFSVAVVRLCRSARGGVEARVIVAQLIRSATSVAANYRAACRSRSRREFIARIGVAIEECDETLLWLELLTRLNLIAVGRMTAILQEGNQLLAIFVVSKATAIRRLKTSLK